MTSRQQWLIQGSFDLVRDMPQAVAMLFYGRIFDLAPSVRPLFKADIRSQAQKLVDTLGIAVDSAGNIDKLRPVLRTLGERHASYGAAPEHYPVVCEALLWALGQALQQDFDPETRAAWRELLEEISQEMIAGAHQPV